MGHKNRNSGAGCVIGLIVGIMGISAMLTIVTGTYVHWPFAMVALVLMFVVSLGGHTFTAGRLVIKHRRTGEVLAEVPEIAEANLQGRRLQWGEVTNTSLYRTSFHEADLEHARFSWLNNEDPNHIARRWWKLRLFLEKLIGDTGKDYWRRTGFCGAKLANTSFDCVGLYHADFSGADLHDAKFEDVGMPEADFCDANMARVTITRATIEQACFKNANLQGASCEGVSFKGSCFDRANLQDAKLVRANLSGCSFREANLVHADLTQAVLVEADVSGANLEGAAIAGVDWTHVRYDGKTRWPDGFRPR